MNEPFDVFCDWYSFSINPEGIKLGLSLTAPTGSGNPEQEGTRYLGTIRMTIPQLKGLTFAMWAALGQMESEGTIVTQPPPPGLLEDFEKSLEDWGLFWQPGP